MISQLTSLGGREYMAANRAIYLAVSLSVSFCFGQSGPQPLTQGSVVIGQCQNHMGAPGCVLPSLFGANGLTLANNSAFPHYAHFTGNAQELLAQDVGTSIATQLAILPIISPASGFTYRYDSAAGAFVRSTTSFGPIYTERAETIGRGKFYFGISYQRFRFSTLDGINLHNIPAVFSHIPDTGPGGAAGDYENDVIKSSNSIDLHMDQTMFYGTVGLTDRLDVSVAVPLVSVRMSASSNASIVPVSGNSITTVPNTPPFNPHQFANGSLTNVFTSNGNATGIGDVTFRVKDEILRGQRVRMALLLDVRTPTGNAMEYLGSGAIGIKPFLAISTGGRISPHVNLGYQWNGNSILAGNITGTTFPAGEVTKNGVTSPLIQTGPSIKGKIPPQFFYSAGVDFGITNRLTFAVDYLGQTLFNQPSIFLAQTVTKNFQGVYANGLPAQTLPTITGAKDTIGLNSGAAGLKYNLFGNLLLSADILFRLDDKGLRQDITPLISLSYVTGR
jgi:hypothetical protein